MNAFIFVSIVCMNGVCEFMTSTSPVSETRCTEIKKVFLGVSFKPEVTLAAAQCMKINDGKNI